MNFVIREYTTKDWLDLMLLSSDQWADAIKQTAISMLKNYDGLVIKTLLAFCDGKLAGFIYGFILPNHTLIPEFMYIKPEYRHNGAAQKLLTELESQSGCSASMIFYAKTLHDFYQRQGYNTSTDLEVAVKNL